MASIDGRPAVSNLSPMRLVGGRAGPMAEGTPGAGGRHAVLRGITTISKRRTARLAATGIARGDHDRRRARRRSARRGEKTRRARRWRALQWRYNRCSKAREGSARRRGGSQRCGRTGRHVERPRNSKNSHGCNEGASTSEANEQRAGRSGGRRVGPSGVRAARKS